MKLLNSAKMYYKVLFDTIIVAPFQFGQFLGNLSGLAGKKQQLKAQAELRIAQEAFNAVLHNQGGARDFMIKELGDDILKRPGYYLGSLGIGKVIKAPSAITTVTGKTIELDTNNSSIKQVSWTELNSWWQNRYGIQ